MSLHHNSYDVTGLQWKRYNELNYMTLYVRHYMQSASACFKNFGYIKLKNFINNFFVHRSPLFLLIRQKRKKVLNDKYQFL